jgi:hypothetical protein
MRKVLAILAVSALSLSGCSEMTPEWSTNSNSAPVTDGVPYAVTNNWTLLPADHPDAKDLMMRLVKINGVCYLHTYMVYDSTQYQLIPTNRDCGPKS